MACGWLLGMWLFWSWWFDGLCSLSRRGRGEFAGEGSGCRVGGFVGECFPEFGHGGALAGAGVEASEEHVVKLVEQPRVLAMRRVNL